MDVKITNGCIVRKFLVESNKLSAQCLLQKLEPHIYQTKGKC